MSDVLLEVDAHAVKGAVGQARSGLVDRELIAEVVVLCAVADQQQGAVTRYAQRQEHDERGFGIPISSGDALGLVTPDCSMDVEVGDRPVARSRVLTSSSHSCGYTTGSRRWTEDGRIAVIDSGSSKVLANFRTRL